MEKKDKWNVKGKGKGRMKRENEKKKCKRIRKCFFILSSTRPV